MSGASAARETSAVDEEIAKSVRAGKGWSEEERAAYLAKVSEEDHPIFAERIEDMDPAMVKAFRDLTYEDETPLSLGEHFKKVGNERFARGKQNAMYYRHAEQSYTEGLRNVRQAEKVTPELKAVTVALLSNRAAAHLVLKNYGSCRRDCDEALKLSPENLKCLYRKAKAELMLRKYRESLAVCREGLKLDPDNKELLNVRAECERAIKGAELKAAAAKMAQERRLEELASVWDACEAVGIRLGPSAFSESNHERRNDFVPVADDEGGVTWPVLLLYPQNGQSDLIQQFRLDDMVAEHLARVFPEEGPPAPWDESFEYRCSELSVYLPLGQVDPSPSVYEWVAEFEKMEASKKGAGADGSDDDESMKNAGKGVDSTNRRARLPRWARVHPGCTLHRVLTCDGYVVAGATPTLSVYPQSSRAHADFVKSTRGRIIDLPP